MDSGRLGRRWLLACAGTALLANYFGGFSFIVTGVFVFICLIGASLIGSGEDPVGVAFPEDDAAAEDGFAAGSLTGPVDVVAPPEVAVEHAEPYPGDDGDDESPAVDVTAETEASPA
jgi:hypothetical protein